MKTNQILLFAGIAALGVGAYMYMSKPKATTIPPGGTWNGYANTSGGNVTVSIINGVAAFVNALGQVLQTVPWNQTSDTGGYTGGNNNPDSGNGTWVDSQGSLVWVPNA